MFHYASFKRKNKETEGVFFVVVFLNGKGGNAGGQIAKVWIPTWQQDSVGNRERRKADMLA